MKNNAIYGYNIINFYRRIDRLVLFWRLMVYCVEDRINEKKAVACDTEFLSQIGYYGFHIRSRRILWEHISPANIPAVLYHSEIHICQGK